MFDFPFHLSDVLFILFLELFSYSFFDHFHLLFGDRSSLATMPHNFFSLTLKLLNDFGNFILSFQSQLSFFFFEKKSIFLFDFRTNIFLKIWKDFLKNFCDVSLGSRKFFFWSHWQWSLGLKILIRSLWKFSKFRFERLFIFCHHLGFSSTSLKYINFWRNIIDRLL